MLDAMPAITVESSIVSGAALTNMIIPAINSPACGVHVILRLDNQPITDIIGNHHLIGYSQTIDGTPGAVCQIRNEEDTTKETVEYTLPITINELPGRPDLAEYPLYANLHIKITNFWKNVEVTCEDVTWNYADSGLFH